MLDRIRFVTYLIRISTNNQIRKYDKKNCAIFRKLTYKCDLDQVNYLLDVYYKIIISNENSIKSEKFQFHYLFDHIFEAQYYFLKKHKCTN